MAVEKGDDKYYDGDDPTKFKTMSVNGLGGNLVIKD